MSFDSDSLEPSLHSPTPLAMSGGDIQSLRDIYLTSINAGATERSLSDEQWQWEECAGWAGSTRSQQGVATSYAVGLRKASRGFIQQDFHVQPGALAGCQRDAPFCEQICSADEGAHAHDDAAGVGSDACAALCAGDDALFSRIPSNRNRDRRPKSWEFVIRLLANKQTNPALIKWEEEAQGTFRFVQPKVVARMWGTVFSGKPNLSYNNFARDLRHFYKPGAIQAVPNKQLVYRCGPEALAYFERLQTN